MSGNRIGIVASLDDKVSSGLEKIRDKLDRLGGKGTGAVAFGNIAAKGLGLIEHAAHQALDAVGDALIDVVKAGIASEASMQKLTTSLKANVAGWDGNTEAIDRTTKANLDFGFSAIEQRDSLARLVAATHSTAGAFEVLHVAMDLARFKGISLSDATDALTKVEAGSYRILKSLGIVLKANATQTDALAAVEKVAGGQAEDYAETVGGKLLVAQTKFGDEMERLGEKVLPFISDRIDDLNRALEGSGDAMANQKDFLAGMGDDLGQIPGGLRDVVDNGLDLLSFWDDFTTTQDDATRAMRDATKAAEDLSPRVDESTMAVRRMKDDVDRLAAAAAKTATSIERSDRRIEVASAEVRAKLLADATALVDGYYGVLSAKDALSANKAETAAQRKILASKKSTAAEKAEARTALLQLGGDKRQFLEDLATAGGSGSKVVQKAMSDYLKTLTSAHGAERRAIEAEILKLELLAAAAYAAQQAVRKLPSSAFHGHDKKDGNRATGGPVLARRTYTIGEDGPETLVMGATGGYVLPNTLGGGTGGGGQGGTGGGNTLVVQTLWPPTPQQIKAMADALDHHDYWAGVGSSATGNRT